MSCTRRVAIPAAVVSALALAGATPALAANAPQHAANDTQAAGFCSGGGAPDAASAVQQDWNTLHEFGSKVHAAKFLKELKADVACYPPAERAGYRTSIKQLAHYLKKHSKLSLTVRWSARHATITGDTWTSPNQIGSALVSTPASPTECVTEKTPKASGKFCLLYSSWPAPLDNGLIEMTVQNPSSGAWYVTSQTPGTAAPTSPVAPPASDSATCMTPGYAGAPSAAQAAQENFNTLASGNTAGSAGAPLDLATNLNNEMPCITPDEQSYQQNLVNSVGSYEMTYGPVFAGFYADGPIDTGSVYTSPTAPNSAIVTLSNNPTWMVYADGQTQTTRFNSWLEPDAGIKHAWAPIQRETQDPTTGLWTTNIIEPGITAAQLPSTRGNSARHLNLPGLKVGARAHGAGGWLSQLGL